MIQFRRVLARIFRACGWAFTAAARACAWLAERAAP
jgi:hypothetical protein